MIILKYIGGLAVAVAMATLTPARAAAPEAEYPDAVPLFQKSCLSGDLSQKVIADAVAADTDWVRDDAVDIDVRSLGVSKAIDRGYDFSKPGPTEQWSRQISGKRVRLILASFPKRKTYSTLCAIIYPDVQSAMPYAGDLKAAFKAVGVGGKSVDLIHYFEFADKIGPENKRVRGEIFSRSLATGQKNTMHIYVAF